MEIENFGQIKLSIYLVFHFLFIIINLINTNKNIFLHNLCHSI